MWPALILFHASPAQPAPANARPAVQILVNQVGYRTGGDLRLLFQCTGAPPTGARPRLVGRTVTAHLTPKGLGEIDGWARRYYGVTIPVPQQTGWYHVEGWGAKSPRFRIDRDVIFRATAELAQSFFYYQRCGAEVPGWHGPCHLDDARAPDGTRRDVSGGWHDAGDYNKYNGYTPLSVYALATIARAWPQGSARQRAALDEALWGAEWLRKMRDEKTGRLWGRVFSGYGFWGDPASETDNEPGNDDDRPLLGAPSEGYHNEDLAIAGFALLGAGLDGPEGEPWLALARRMYEQCADLDRDGLAQAQALLAGLALADTGYDCLDSARRRADQLLALQAAGKPHDGAYRRHADRPPSCDICCEGLIPAALSLFALREPADSPLRARIAESLTRHFAFQRSLADGSPFGLARFYLADGSAPFFRPHEAETWNVGQNSHYLSLAWAALLASELTGDKAIRALADRQLDWVLGLNYFGICMVEGVGAVNPPRYHHRYMKMEPTGAAAALIERGAVPGTVPNGIVRAAPDRDVPGFDLATAGVPAYESNEQWLPHNAFYLLAMSRLAPRK